MSGFSGRQGISAQVENQQGAGNQEIRDYLDWQKSLFLPLPDYILKNLAEVASLSKNLMENVTFEKNPEIFTAQKQAALLALLTSFESALKPRSGGENEITRLSETAGEIMVYYREMDFFRIAGKLVFEEKFVSPFWESLNAWNGMLTQFRWIERTISAYIAQIEAAEDAELKKTETVHAEMKALLTGLPPLLGAS